MMASWLSEAAMGEEGTFQPLHCAGSADAFEALEADLMGLRYDLTLINPQNLTEVRGQKIVSLPGLRQGHQSSEKGRTYLPNPVHILTLPQAASPLLIQPHPTDYVYLYYYKCTG
jgi:hypothetical protein